jgi:hypothetical protein
MTLQHCPLNAEFQHFIPRFNEFTCFGGPRSTKGYIEGGKRRPQRQGKDRVTLRKTGMALDLLCQSSNHGIYNITNNCRVKFPTNELTSLQHLKTTR